MEKGIARKKTPISSAKTTSKDVAEFLTKTGFILEMEVAEMLIKLGYSIEVNSDFYDYNEDKKREIDIIASKEFEEIDLYLIIECKQSLIDDWIFICSDKRPKRYYGYIKNFPLIDKINETQVLDHLHIFDRNISLAQNFIIKDRQNKKSTSLQIATCLEKLPKALVDFAYSHSGNKKRRLYIPIAVYSGQIFTAQYNKNLEVKSSDLVLYESELESENYTYHWPSFSSAMYLGGGEQLKQKQNSIIAETSRFLGYSYLITFVTRKGLINLTKRIETDIEQIDFNKWPLSLEPQKNA